MKKYLSLIVLAGLVLASATIVFAHTIAYNPEDTMSYMTVPVYNNSGSTLSAGAVVVWDIGSSSLDNDAWVTTTTSADTSIVAGIIWPYAIDAGKPGSMAVWGLAECDMGAFAVSAGTPICTSTSAGTAGNCGSERAMIGITGTATAGNEQVKCFVNTR